jgi:hypothetical protein
MEILQTRKSNYSKSSRLSSPSIRQFRRNVRTCRYRCFICFDKMQKKRRNKCKLYYLMVISIYAFILIHLAFTIVSAYLKVRDHFLRLQVFNINAFVFQNREYEFHINWFLVALPLILVCGYPLLFIPSVVSIVIYDILVSYSFNISFYRNERCQRMDQALSQLG